MATDSLYTAIDIGTTKVATVVARVATSGEMDVVALGRSASAGLQKGLVADAGELTAAVRASTAEASSMLGRKLPPAHVGITGAHLTSVNAASQIAARRGRKGPHTFTQEDVNRLLRSTYRSNGHRVVHILPRAFQVDGFTDVRDPLGMTGEQLAAESHVVLGDPRSIQALQRVVSDAGLKMSGLVVENLASAEAVLAKEERDAGVVLVDIGGGTSDIAIFRNGAPWFTATVPVAGSHFTNDLSVGLGLPIGIAEQLKVEHGSAIVDGVDPKAGVEVSDGGLLLPRTVYQTNVNQLLRDRAVELVKLVLQKVALSGLRRVPPAGIVLTGGSADLHGLADVAAEYGSCMVRVGSPISALGLPEELEHSSFSTAVGLLLWAIQQRHAGAVSPDVALNPSVAMRLRGWLGRLTRTGGSPSAARV